jgi:FAD dependent oxidoreductase TIGR03364
MSNRAAVAVVGSGIVGLANAWAAARRGLSVVVFERDRRPLGASVRNFGMIWPIGQPAGPAYQRALLGRQLWLDLARAAGFWITPCGSLHLAYQPDELAVLEEFVARAPESGSDGPAGALPSCRLLAPAEVLRQYPAVRPDGLRGGLWSPTELAVDPRQALAAIPAYLRDAHGVQFRFGTAVTAIDRPWVRTAGGETWHAERVLVCSGVDFRTLFPEVFAASGLQRCKLQMLRTVPQPAGFCLGTHLAGGLTLCHYPSFHGCPSLGPLRQRIHRERPDLVRYGIHVMAAQNEAGEVVIGDSHEYDEDGEPFDKPAIDELILGYLRGLVRLPDWTIASRWHGSYARHPDGGAFTAEPQPGVTVVSAAGGAGMTLSFGNAEAWWDAVAGPAAGRPPGV